jgi:putative ABC transport system substrate-binding protein
MFNDPTISQRDVGATEAVARQLAVQLLRFDIREAGDLEPAFLAAKRDGAEALDVLASAFFNANRRRLVDLAARNRLPAIYESREYAEAGGLLTYGQDLFDLFRRAASYVDRILKGANRRSACRAGRQVRTDHQPQDRQGSRPDDPALAAGAGGSGY